MAQYEIQTIRGYALLDVSSALQKSIRRSDHKMAMYMAMELFKSNFGNYAWKRILTIGAEDVEDWIQRELVALHYSYEMINKGVKEKKGRIFISKAVMILCKAYKSRETDHGQCLLYDLKLGVTDEEIKESLEDHDHGVVYEFPDYTWDVHTKKGKQMGKTKKTFFLEEDKGLLPMGEDLFSEQLKMYVGEIKDDKQWK